jgi:hypothetical protein
VAGVMVSVLLPRDLADFLDQAAREEQCGYGELVERMLLTQPLPSRNELRARFASGRLTEKVQFRMSKNARRALRLLRGRAFTKSQALRGLICYWFDRVHLRAPLPSPPLPMPAAASVGPPAITRAPVSRAAPPVRPAATGAIGQPPQSKQLAGGALLTPAQQERAKAYLAREFSCRYCHSGAWGTVISHAEHEQLARITGQKL